MRLAILCALCWCGPIACASAVGGGQLRAAEATKGLDEALDDIDAAKYAVNKSSATPEEKAAITDRLNKAKAPVQAAKPVVGQLGKDVDHNQSVAISNEAKAKAMNLIIAFLALSAIGLFFWWRSRKNSAG